MMFPNESTNKGIASNKDLLRLSYTVLPPAKEISLSFERPPNKIPTLI